MEQENPLVSIIIPVYNTEKYLIKCLNSVINQTYSNIEAIVIDDGSPDQAVIIVQEFCRKDKRFTLIRQENSGLAEARNVGIFNANGKYLLFLDSDDALTLDAIDGLVKLAEKENFDIVIPDRYYKIIENTEKKTLQYHFTEKEYISRPVEFALKVIIGKGRAWRATSVLYLSILIHQNKVLFPNEFPSEDIVFNLNVMSIANKIAFYNDVTTLNLKREGSISNSYNRNLVDMNIYIDSQVNNFLIKNKLNNESGKKYLDSLLCRNTVLALTNLMRPINKSKLIVKYTDFRNILRIKRVKNAFKNKEIETPYFMENKIKYYFKIMYFLLSNRFVFPAFIFIFFVMSIINRRNKIVKN